MYLGIVHDITKIVQFTGLMGARVANINVCGDFHDLTSIVQFTGLMSNLMTIFALQLKMVREMGSLLTRKITMKVFLK